MVRKIKLEYTNIFKYAQNNLFLVGLLGILGFPLYYIIWKYIYPQTYESLSLRLSCAALFLPWIFYNKLPIRLLRFFPLYFFISLFISIPLFFTYMLFANNFSSVWLMSYLAAIYLAILLIYHWWLIIIMYCIAIIINLIFYPYNNINPSEFAGFDTKYIPIYLFAIVSGILCHRTERKSQFKLRNMKSFGGGIAHEMRNPLNAINLLTSRIRSIILTSDNSIKKRLDLNEIEEISKNLNIILGCTTRASEVIDMILENIKEKVKQQKLEFLSTSDLLSSAIKEYGFDHENQREKVILNTKENFIIKAEKTAFTYVVFNLLKNALYYLNSYPNEYVKIYLKRGSKQSLYNQIIVEDNGPGIPEDKIKYIFDSFYTSGKKEGTGLGLDFCKKTMEGFNGKIECTSKVGKLTKFILSFPKISESELEKLIPIDNKSKFDRLSKNIIIFENKNLLKNSKEFNSEISNYKIRINYLNQAKIIISELKSHYNYDLLLIQSGDNSIFEMIKKIRKFHNEIPIIIYDANDLDKVNLINLGVDEVIVTSDKEKSLIIRSILKWNIINNLPQNFDTSKTYNLSSKNILLADDDPVNRLMLSKILEKKGFNVDKAKNGQELNDKFFEENSKYDVLITDINMPIMNGDEVAKNIRKSNNKHNNIPIIAYSGDSEKEKIHKFLRCQINDFYIKGDDTEYLNNLVNFWTN